MLKLSVKTRYDPFKNLELAEQYFVGKLKLNPIDRIAHFHGKESFIEIKTSGIMKQENISSKTILNDFTKYVKEKYDFNLETLALHLHSNIGHVNVLISNENPATVTLESYEFDYQVQEFAKEIA